MLLAGSGGRGSGSGYRVRAVGGMGCAGQRLPVIVSPTAGGFTQSFAPMVRELRLEGAATQRGGSRCWPVRPFSRKHWTRGLHDAGMRFCADWPLTTGLTSGWTENHVTGYSIVPMFAVVKGGLSVGRGVAKCGRRVLGTPERYPSPNPLPQMERYPSFSADAGRNPTPAGRTQFARRCPASGTVRPTGRRRQRSRRREYRPAGGGCRPRRRR